ncbi:histidinol dehydrogenase [Nocardioides sp. zg-1228]|uniref:histidinol dehydrogenase n=1 Tax=Nocardioides sp. zg-1228 TaxID=2763008 RepID=UPI0019803CC4|nr:histidinol dehydrogenase [Nocardioides sp. zg-1228]QSF56317.1 histidinol dehydrogenase [Nocardioides sp. zg-1228]
MSLIRRIDLRGADAASVDYRASVPRAEFDVEAATHVVAPIIEAVRTGGADAVRALTLELDGVDVPDPRVPPAALRDALEALDPAVRAGLEESIRRLRLTSEADVEADSVVEVAPGATVTHRSIPVDRAGLYVPGGLAPLVSTLVMNVVPAQVAGVPSLCVAAPPTRETGLPDATILAGCALLGIDEVYAVGGAQAIAMLAHGAGPCRRVDLVTGPGNLYVIAAKRLLRGVVGIDSEAGPSEIAVLADDSADPAFVAADLLTECEHGGTSASLLVTDSTSLADEVEAELGKQVAATRHGERVAAALGGPQSAIVLVDDLEQGLDVVNAYASEHTEIHTRDARGVAARVRNAGAVFIGPWSPVALGDYCAGSNHVLPTAGCACHSSGLGVHSFMRRVHHVEYTREALAEVADHVVTLAEAEDLPGHGAGVSSRFADRSQR